jgi:hypothetical protein
LPAGPPRAVLLALLTGRVPPIVIVAAAALGRLPDLP